MEYLNAIPTASFLSQPTDVEHVAEFSTSHLKGWHSGTDYPFIRFFPMPKEPITVPKPEPAEPTPAPPVKDPQPYTDPVEPPPGDPQEDRPMHDPVQPGQDVPRS